MRTGPRKLPALPQPSGSSLSPCALHLPAENRHFCAEISNARLIYYTSKPPFFQISVFRFMLKPPQNRPFSRIINRKKPLFCGFSRHKTPGCVYIRIDAPHPQNARQRVHPSLFRTLCFLQAKSIRIFTAASTQPVRAASPQHDAVCADEVCQSAKVIALIHPIFLGRLPCLPLAARGILHQHHRDAARRFSQHI